MKEKRLSVKGTSRTVLRPFSSFEALIIEVIICLLLFVFVIRENSSTFAFNTTEYSSVTVDWVSPKAYVFQTNVPNSTCQPSGSDTGGYNTNCRLNSQYPGQRSYYNVIVKDINGNNYTYKTTYRTATSGGSGPWYTTADWDWQYGIAVFPSNFADCAQAGTECRATTLISNQKSLSVTFNNLKPNTNYKKFVCVPNCGNGVAIKNPPTQLSATPARLSGAITNCSGDSVNIAFGWTPSAGAQYDAQFLDYSVYDNNFSSQFVGKEVPVGQSTYTATGFAKGTTYYWRINNRLTGTSSGWVTSATGTFNTPPCVTTPVIDVACQTVDYNKDGAINVVDISLLTNRVNGPFDSVYDLNRDGVLNLADVSIVAAKAGQLCYPRDYAVGLREVSQTPSGTSFNCSQRVKVDWYPATPAGNFDLQYIDFSTGGSFTPGTFFPRQLPPDATTYTVGLGGGRTYYWRVNTRKTTGEWNPSAVKKIVTKQCAIVPTNLTATPATTEIIPGTGTKCTSAASYTASFSWQNSGYGWRINVSDGTTAYSRPVDNLTTLFAPDGNWSPALTFRPGANYIWSIFNGIETSGGQFSVPTCAVPSGGDVSGGSTDANKTAIKDYLHQKTLNGTKIDSMNIIVRNACVGTATPDCPQNFAMFLYGLAGCEHSWDPVGPGPYWGLFQYLPSTWNADFARAFPGQTVPDITSGTVSIATQIDVTVHKIGADLTFTAGLMTTQWPGCTNGSEREWNQFISDYN